MALDSSERIYHELLHEFGGLWHIHDDFGQKIMLKIPSTAIKALISGCKMSMIYGKDTQHIFPFFHAGVRIYDDLIHFLSLSCIQRFVHEHESIQAIMASESVSIHFHNELAICIGTAKLSIAKCDRERVLSLLGNVQGLYSGSYNNFAIHSHNCFDYTLNKEKWHPMSKRLI